MHGALLGTQAARLDSRWKARERVPSVLRIGSIVLRVDDLERQTEFWEAALDYERSVPLRPGWKSTAAFRLRNPDSSRS